MELYICLFLLSVNLLISFAIAGTLVKLVRSLNGEDKEPEEEELISVDRSYRYFRNEEGELVETGPTYDSSVLQGVSDPYSDGVINRPPTQNWDGVSE